MERAPHNTSLTDTYEGSADVRGWVSYDERGISVAELARRIGFDRKRPWYVLNGQREMRVDGFLMLCVALEVDPRSFITRSMVDSVMTAAKKGSE